ncbi:branched-chain amino acid ABC transporter permease [Nonomuraea sp. 3N208]|uniref:branched-chain amino acid ABC transporter permease n=1 Tax=Nonomuraea sp. 3N208 TaxID=3457421 RepID=UPI003FD29BD8
MEDSAPLAQVVTRPAGTGLTRLRNIRAYLPGALLALATALVIPGVTDAFWLKTFTVVAIYAPAAAGVGLLYGRVGLVSLGQVALLGVGGWITLRLGFGTGLPYEVVLLLAGVGTTLIGTLVGLPALRLRGLNLAIVTLMLAAAFQYVFGALQFPDGGGGFSGHSGKGLTMSRPALAGSDPAYFRYCIVVAALSFLAMSLLLRGRAGRAWAAIRQSEAGALASGVNVTRGKLLAIVVVSFVTGVAGGLLATNIGNLFPDGFRARGSLELYAVVLMGGAFSLWGAPVAALLYVALPALLTHTWHLDGNLLLVVFGVGLIHSLSTSPTGLTGGLGALAGRLRRGREPAGEKATDA